MAILNEEQTAPVEPEPDKSDDLIGVAEMLKIMSVRLRDKKVSSAEFHKTLEVYDSIRSQLHRGVQPSRIRFSVVPLKSMARYGNKSATKRKQPEKKETPKQEEPKSITELVREIEDEREKLKLERRKHG